MSDFKIEILVHCFDHNHAFVANIEIISFHMKLNFGIHMIQAVSLYIGHHPYIDHAYS